MRDIFEEIFENQPLDPEESARRSMRPNLRARFYQASAVGEGPDGFAVLLDGRPVQTLRVDAERHVHRIGPLRLAPGEHTLVFRPTDPGAIGFGLVDDGEPRALSFAIGTWRWAVDEARR